MTTIYHRGSSVGDLLSPPPTHFPCDTLQGKRWGSFGRNLACMLILVAQLFALGFTLDFIIRERRAARHREG